MMQTNKLQNSSTTLRMTNQDFLRNYQSNFLIRFSKNREADFTFAIKSSQSNFLIYFRISFVSE